MTLQENNEEIISSVIIKLKKNLGEELTLKVMADILYLSPFYFNRIFRKATGLPPKEFLSALRMEKSKELLNNTNLRITDICLEVGFKSLGTFTNRFHKYVGVSPKDYRKGNSVNDYMYTNKLGRYSILRGKINKEFESNESIVVGLFNKAIPQGVPISCAILEDPLNDEFDIKITEKGTYYLFAVSGMYSTNILQASFGPINISNFEENDEVILNLRRPKEIDPPILVSLPIDINVLANMNKTRQQNIEKLE